MRIFNLAIFAALLLANSAGAEFYKNTGGRITFALYDPADGSLVSGDAAQLSATVSIDGDVTPDVLTDTSATEIGSTGYYQFDTTAGETNGTHILYFCTSSTSADYQAVLTGAYTSTVEASVGSLNDFDPATEEVTTDSASRTASQAVLTTLESRLSSARAGYLDKLNVSGTLAHSDAAASYVADLSTLETRLSSARAGYLDFLDAAISSRLATAGYTVPPSTAAISALVGSDLATTHGAGSWATATGFSTHGAADVWTEAGRALSTPTDYMADLSTLEGRLTLARAGYLDNLDATISSRLSTAGYTVPPTAVQVRQEIDSNSIYLSTMAAKIDTLNTDWLNGGRLDLILDQAAAAGGATKEQIAAEVDSVLSAAHGGGTWGGAAGDGTEELNYTLTLADLITAVPQAKIEVFTDFAMTNRAAILFTDNFGKCTFYLDPGTYYIRRTKFGHTFANPQTGVVAP